MMSNVEEQAMPDETDELKRKAMERIAKLRNLSFNINAADPNNEFESVPAYLRRNMELHNSIADVESFYSNYTVKSNQNNQAEIGTINTFLEGKKPDWQYCCVCTFIICPGDVKVGRGFLYATSSLRGAKRGSNLIWGYQH